MTIKNFEEGYKQDKKENSQKVEEETDEKLAEKVKDRVKTGLILLFSIAFFAWAIMLLPSQPDFAGIIIFLIVAGVLYLTSN